MPRIMGVTKVRHDFTTVVNEADEHGQPIYLTNFNEPRAVLIGYEAFENLIKRIDDLEDALAIYAGREEPREPFDEAWAEIEQEAADREQVSTAAGQVR